MKRIDRGDWSAVCKGHLGAGLTSLRHREVDVLVAAPERARRLELAAGIPLLPTFGRSVRGWAESGGLLAPAGSSEGHEWWEVPAREVDAAFELSIGSERGWEQAARYNLKLTPEGMLADLVVRNSSDEGRRSAIGQRFRVPVPAGSEIRILDDAEAEGPARGLPQSGTVTVNCSVGGLSITRPDGSTTRIAVDGGARFDLSVIDGILIATVLRKVLFGPSSCDASARKELSIRVGI